MKRLLATMLLVIATPVSAVIPENGWWWASNESGRGFNIEVQNNLLFFAAFAYENNGAPTWLISGGPMSGDRDFSGALTKFSAGQCFGCPYSAPAQIAAGNLSLHFTSSQTAVLTINGTSISVKRFDFWGLNETVPDAMMGQWSMVIGDSTFPVYEGERIDWTSHRSDSNGPYLAGNRLGSASNISTVAYSSSGQNYYALLDSSSSYWRFFKWTTTGFNRIEGAFWIVDKTASGPSGSGTFFMGHRTASAAYVQTGNGPHASKRASREDSELQESRDASLAKAVGLRTMSEIDPDALEAFAVLKARAAFTSNP